MCDGVSRGGFMLKITLGEMLKRFRIEKGLEAGQVCKGLCSNTLMSHFEQGRKVPDTLLFQYMMERMGVSPELFSVMVSREEYEYYVWKEKVSGAIVEREVAKLEELLASKIAKTTYCNSKLEKQFLLYATALHFGINKKYSEAFEMLERAVKETIPNMEEIGNGKVLLSAMELHMLMLYLYYGVLAKKTDIHRGMVLFNLLEKYVVNENLELILRAKIYPKLCCVGIELFDSIMEAEQQRALCEKSVELMVQDMSFHEITNVLRLYIPLLEKNKNSKVNFYKKQYEVFEDILKTENVETEFYAESLVATSPKIYIINEYLLSRRRAKDMTQEELSEGICEPETYSRVETGKRAPSKKNLRSLAERLDINWCYFRGELDTSNLKAFELRLKEKEAHILGDDERCIEILQELEKNIDMDNVVNVQYVKANEYIAKYHLGILTEEETYLKLEELLNLTMKEKSSENYLVYYSQTEIEIIAHMAQLLRHMKTYEEGIREVQKVLNQIKKNEHYMKYQWRGYEFLLRVLANLYFESKKYAMTIEIIKYVQNENIKRREAGNLAETLDGIADAYEHIGKQYSDEYKKLYRYTYYVADFFQKEYVAEFMKKFYEENFESSMIWY